MYQNVKKIIYQIIQFGIKGNYILNYIIRYKSKLYTKLYNLIYKDKGISNILKKYIKIKILLKKYGSPW